MAQYDFKNLSPIDFEILSRDLLQEDKGIRFESFKSGKDQGIDFRHSTNSDGKIIVQCKHYAETGFDKLYYNLCKYELPKVKLLNPKSYILVTSLALNPSQKDKIVKEFDPYIVCTGDIYCQGDVNNLLTKYQKIEKDHFKLWFASTTVFEQMLNKRLLNITREALDTIKEHARYYVHNESYPEALKILSKYNFCIIAGMPGIGKTTLAEMISIHYLEQKYDVVKVLSDISEASEFDYLNQKKIFFYDDFLGQNSLADKLNKNEDQKLLEFIRAIGRSKFSKLILTTREYILNQAKMKYEKLDRENFQLETCLIDLSKYTRAMRAKILFNHLYFSDIPDKYKESLLKNNTYIRIIDHKNYNPRIISVMTKHLNLNFAEPDEYSEVFISNLENPYNLWKHAFEEQLSFAAKNLLIVLGTFSTEILLDDLQRAFNSYNRAQSDRYNTTHTPLDFKRALKELDGTFIISEKIKKKIVLKFQNPSIVDFIKGYFTLEYLDIDLLLNSVVSHDQLITLWNIWNSDISKSKDKNKYFKYLNIFLIKYQETFEDEGMNLTIYGNSYGNIDYLKWKYSCENRIKLLLSVMDYYDCKNVRRIFINHLDIIKRRIKNLEADKDDLAQLIEGVIDGDRLKMLPAEFNESVKKYLMLKPDDIQEYDPLLKMFEICPYMFTQEDLVSIRNNITETANEIEGHNADQLRVDASRLATLGETFNLNFRNKIENLECRASEMDNKFGNIENENDDYNLNDEGDGFSDKDIESIFAMLEVSS